MEFNVILAGVGGQGILTIAQAISRAAMRRGLSIRQSEVHGMAQRGGAVQSHLRLADHELHSDLIPYGRADMILAVEPLEALRYVEYLADGGVVVASSAPFVNIDNYPPVERVLSRIAATGRHVLVDANRLAAAAGASRAANTAVLGAASCGLPLEFREIEAAVSAMMERRGDAAVQTNLRALRLGRHAAEAYVEGVGRGGTPNQVRHWIETLPVDRVAEEVRFDEADWPDDAVRADLSAAEIHAVEQMLKTAADGGRRQLFEHEVYALVELAGAISPPRYVFVRPGEMVNAERLAGITSSKAALKIVSQDVVHKTEAGGVVFVPNDAEQIERELTALVRRQQAAGGRVDGVLVVEYVEHERGGLGHELFVGIRTSREFGPVIAAGLGGVDTEYLAVKMGRGLAVAKALACDTSAEAFFDVFRQTAAYELLAGRVRGRERVVSDGELLRCFRAFIAIARRFCVSADDASASRAACPLRAASRVLGPGPAWGIAELEVNPFAFVRQRMVPLDGRGRIGPLPVAAPDRPRHKIAALLKPRSIAVMGVSSRRKNFGRIILNNIQACGFPTDRTYVVKERCGEIDGVRCVPDLAALPEPVDVLVVATSGGDPARLIDQVIDTGRATAVILIPGGLGEKEGTEDVLADLRGRIVTARQRPDGGPIFLGGNCLGVRSHPGRYNTFFVPSDRLAVRGGGPPRRLAMVSQSGAFVITRMSNLESLDPAIAVSIGNQVDLTAGDVVHALADRDDVDCIAAYVEGFNDLDGLAFVRAVEAARARGKVVVFYKAGRTSVGASATAGHTASVAGDYDVCDAALVNAGAIVVDTFKEFEQLIELATCLHGKHVGGRRVGAVSNAGYEAVGMADAIRGQRYLVEMPTLSPETAAALSDLFARAGIDRWVNVRNPLDLTPMANDQAYEDCARRLLAAPEIDALVVSTVPMTTQLLTTPDVLDRPDSFAARMIRLFHEADKPMIVVVDSGPPFEDLVRSIRAGGVPVFRSCDQAIRSLGRYLCHRADHGGAAGASTRPTQTRIGRRASPQTT